MSDSNVFSPDFKEFVELLNLHKAEYLITGGYAVGIYGYPRYTGDLDIWVNNTIENGQKLVAVFDDFGLGSFGLVADTFTKHDQGTPWTLKIELQHWTLKKAITLSG